MPDLPPTESISLKCDGEAVPILFRIRIAGAGAGSSDVVMPCGVYAVTTVDVSRGGYGVAITLHVDATQQRPDNVAH